MDENEEWMGKFADDFALADLSNIAFEDVVDEDFLGGYGDIPAWSADSSFTDSVWDFIGSDNFRNLLNLGSGLYGLYESDKMKDMAKKAYGASDPFGPYRGQYAQQLQALMADPSIITKDPGYQFQKEQGEETIERRMGSKGYLGSGNLGIALQQYGQDYAQNYFSKKAEQLASLAGAGIAPNFGAALSGYGSGIDVASQALASLGYGSVMAGGASEGTPARRPSSAGGEAAKKGNNIGSIIGLTGTGAKVAGSLANLAGYEGTGSALKEAGNTLGNVAGIYSGVKQGDIPGYAKAASSAASLAGYEIPYLGYVDAVSKLAKGDVPEAAISAISTYMPIAGIGFAIADIANKSGKEKAKYTGGLIDALVEKGTLRYASGYGRTGALEIVESGKIVRPGQLARTASEALRLGDTAGFTKAMENWLGNAFDPKGSVSWKDWSKTYGG